MKSGKARELTFYVALDGKDRWSGRLPGPDARGQDGPFRTVAGARNRLRALRRQGGVRAPVRVLVRAGVHALEETLTFTHADSGTQACPVSYAAYPGEQPVLSGGRRISGWKAGEVNGKACWVAEIPDVAGGQWNFTQLFVNGSRRLRPRLPREGFNRLAGEAPGTAPFTGWHTGPDRALFVPGEIRNWKNLDDVELLMLTLWFGSHHHIKRVDEAAHTVFFKDNSIGGIKDERNLWARYRVENVFEALDTAGQWYLDRPAGTLYYLPLPGETIEAAEVVAPVLETLVQFKGSMSKPVAHIHLESLAFKHAEWRLPEGNTGAVQAAFNVPGAIRMQCAEDCRLHGCSIAQISQYGVEILQGSARNEVTACVISDMGAGGVKICHEGLERTDPTNPVPIKPVDKPMRTVVSDCRIHDGGQIFPGAVGVWIGNSGRNTVVHNAIFNLYYTGISCGWIWGGGATLAIGNRIEFNHIYNIGQGLLSDIGGIYLLGPQPGTVVRNNVVHDLYHYGYAGLGYYTDEGSAQILFENNLAYKVGNNAFFQHYGHHNLLRNNIFAMADEAQVGRGGEEKQRSFILERNIFMAGRAELLGGAWGDGHFLLERNVYWRAPGYRYAFAGQSLAEWQATGQDRGSIIADPLFVDPEGGDFRLRADSPALAVGFKPVDFSRVGPRAAAVRRSAAAARGTRLPATIIQTRLEVAEPFAVSGAGAGKVRLVIHNFSDKAVAGRIGVRFRPDTSARVAGKPALPFRLKAGEESSAVFPVLPSPDVGGFAIETCASFPEFVPTCLYVDHHKEWAVPRVAAGLAPEHIEQALGRVPARALERGGTRLAEIKLARAGDSLAVFARVEDRLMVRGKAPWAGSCVEVFGASPESRKIGQVFLLPAFGDAAAAGFRQEGRESVPAPEMRVCSAPVPGGYKVSGLIPLSLLATDPAAACFLIEIAVNGAPDSGRGLVRFTMFGGANAYATSIGYGLIVESAAPRDR